MPDFIGALIGGKIFFLKFTAKIETKVKDADYYQRGCGQQFAMMHEDNYIKNSRAK